MSTQPVKEELRLLARLAPDAQLRLGRAGRWRAASPSVGALLGYDPEALVGRPALDLVHPDDRAGAERAVAAGLAVSDALSLRLRLLHADGSVLRADVRFDAARPDDGGPAGHRVTIRPAADRGRSDELRAHWEVLFGVTRRGIAVTDPRTLALLAVNPAFAAMHGGAVEDFVGLPVARVLTPAAARQLAGLGEEIAASDLLSYEAEHVRADGSVFPAAVEVMAARDADGTQLYWLAWVEDLTERRRSERAAAAHADAMARSNADLDRFAGVVAHDLQSPLRVIAGCARILERRAAGQLDTENRELVDHIVAGVHRMTALLDGVREYARVRAEDAPPEHVDTRALVDDVLASLAADLEAAGAVVRVGALPVVPGHRVLLVQLFQNLIANAVKFRAERPPEIAITADAGDASWDFAVTDNGIGIPPRSAERVFEFGRRLHTDDEVPGTGIGLTVCKTVVERHGGRIWAEPAPGGGTRFRFTLPRGPG